MDIALFPYLLQHFQINLQAGTEGSGALNYEDDNEAYQQSYDDDEAYQQSYDDETTEDTWIKLLPQKTK